MAIIAALALAATLLTQPPGTVRGVVLDRADGSPIADVAVRIQEGGAAVTTDAAGRFEIANVAPGRRTLYVSLVGFILVKRGVDVAPGETVDVTILLSEGTGTYTETVTVTGERFREQEKSVPSQQVLGSAEIQNLRGLLTNDPMRAIQVLPGVTTGDDFRSEFAVRGSPFARMNFTFDGIPTTFLLHTVQQVQDGGSIAMVNGDILDGITLLNGSYPERYGNRLGAELDFHMREGSRDRAQLRLGVSGTDASIVAEGPFGRAKRGSWLISARKSYLELLLRQINEGDSDFGFGFSDTQGKVVYDLTRRQQLEVSVVAGHSGLTQTSPPEDAGTVDDGTNAAVLVDGAWRFTLSPRFAITERLAVALNRFHNRNPSAVEIGHGSGRDVTWRTDVISALGKTVTLEAGGQVQAQRRDESVRFATLNHPGSDFTLYDADATLTSGYAHLRWEPAHPFAASAGARIDRWSLTSDGAASPWGQVELRLPRSIRIKAGGGIYRQFAGFEEAVGPSGRVSNDQGAPVDERAYHADLGVEQMLGSSTRWQVTFYNREERDVLRRPLAEPRVVNGALVPAYPVTPVWENSLNGFARGVEFAVMRRSNRGLSGWLSYSYGRHQYSDRLTGETFDADYDQRHTFNAYGLYRLTNRFTFGAKLRVGSNTPIVGYWEQRGDAYFVGTERNRLRVPAYSRLDLRANRTFNWERKRLTLFVELLNALGHDNVRYEKPGVNPRTLQAFGVLNKMIPFVPSAGILIEF